MLRISPKKKIFTPHLYRDGCYRVADPRFGDDKKKDAFQIRVKTLAEVRGYVARGFHLRMSADDKRPPSLICPQHIKMS